jgi:4-amino-4-deoxy-L-arabinose transferase-like glycosyltransferase
MKKLMKINWFLFFIIILASVLRLYRLGEIPQSLMWDETALGYNAFSILKTARDEYGNFLPLIFKSFGDYKPGLYVYFAVPSVAIFGLNEFAVRLPSAILGILGVLGTYLLTKALLTNSFHLGGVKASASLQPATIRGVSSLTALLLAISPWHIEFSRGAWEANLAVFLISAGILCFLKGLERSRFLILAALFFGLTFLSYQGAKISTPLLLFGLIAIFWRKFRALPGRRFLFFGLTLIILAWPIFWAVVSGMGGRAKVMSVFSYPRPTSIIWEILSQDKTGQNSLTFKLFHSELLNFSRGVLGRYFNHFSGKFLFFEGDWSNKRLGVPYMGVLYFIEILFLPLGIYFLINQRNKQAKYLLFWWLLISPIPAALTKDSISAVRSLNMVIPLTVLNACGLYYFLTWVNIRSVKKLRVMCYVLCVTGYFWSLAYFLDQYFVHAPLHNSTTTQYGYREVVNSIAPKVSTYQRIIFTPKYGQPYIYWLFYTKYDPRGYQQQAKLTESPVGDVGRIEKIDNIEFRDIYWPSDRGLGKSLFIGDEFDLPKKDLDQTPGTKILKEINFLNGQLAFRIVETS